MTKWRGREVTEPAHVPAARKWQNWPLSSGISPAPRLEQHQPSSEMRNQWRGLVSPSRPFDMGNSLLYFLGPGVLRRQERVMRARGRQPNQTALRSNLYYTWAFQPGEKAHAEREGRSSERHEALCPSVWLQGIQSPGAHPKCLGIQ